jgi:hypothetical protein
VLKSKLFHTLVVVGATLGGASGAAGVVATVAIGGCSQGDYPIITIDYGVYPDIGVPLDFSVGGYPDIGIPDIGGPPPDGSTD